MTDPTIEDLRAAAAAAASIAREAGRLDLATRVNEAIAKTERAHLMVAVVGEFKRGKSSLVNGLLGENVCPVSALASTAVPTLLRYGDEPLVRMTVADEAGQRVMEGALEDLDKMVLEDNGGGLAAQRLVAIVDLPNPFLESGYQFIDCAGVGGLGPGFADTALNLAALADVALVVADAGAPLDPATLDFVRRLGGVCPVTLLALTKADMYRRGGATEEVRRQLEAASLAVDVFPVSSHLRFQALERADARLDQESGYPALISALDTVAAQKDEVVWGAAIRAAHDALSALSRTLALDQVLLSAPITEWDAALEDARMAVDLARRNAGRWSTLLNEGVTDAAARAEASLRKALQRILEELGARIDSGELDPQAVQTGALQRVQLAVAEVLQGLVQSTADLYRDLRALFEDGHTESGAPEPAQPKDVTLAWPAAAVPKEPRPSLKEAAGSLYSGLKGAQGGIIMVGVFSGIAGLGLGTLAIAGVGALFGGKQILDERQRRLQAERQQVKNALRQFLDEAQTEGVRAIRELVRDELRREREAIAEIATAFLAAKVDRERYLTLERERTVTQRGARLEEVVRLQSRLAGPLQVLAENAPR